MKAWILTSCWNRCDQEGECFIEWFQRKPTAEELEGILMNEEREDYAEGLVDHVLAGGGRRGKEDVWYHLRERESGGQRKP